MRSYCDKVYFCLRSLAVSRFVSGNNFTLFSSLKKQARLTLEPAPAGFFARKTGGFRPRFSSASPTKISAPSLFRTEVCFCEGKIANKFCRGCITNTRGAAFFSNTQVATSSREEFVNMASFQNIDQRNLEI